MHPHTNAARKPRNGPSIYVGPIMPIKLKQVMIAHDLAGADMADCIINQKRHPLAPSTIYQALNRGVYPIHSTPDFKEQVEAYLTAHGVPSEDVAVIWQDANANVTPLHHLPTDHIYRVRVGMAKKNGEQIPDLLEEATMLTPTAMKHYRLFRSPFLNDITEEKDVYMSSSHRYALAAMDDAARNAGFVAVTGECGGGKSVLRRMLVKRLIDGGDVRVIQPQIPDKRDMKSDHILDAIIDDITPGQKVRRGREQKARQVRNMLVDSANSGQKHVLIIEEAHDLTVPTMKLLKRLWEIEQGMSKVLGIILVGQPELRKKLDMRANFEMREVILRCLLANLDPLDADLEDYIAFKLARISKSVDDIMADGWAGAVRKRLTNRDGYSALYPLHIHNLLARAMNMAAEYGEEKVTTDIILGA